MGIEDTLKKLEEALLSDLNREMEEKNAKLEAEKLQKKHIIEALKRWEERNKEIYFEFDNNYKLILNSSKSNSKKIEEIRKLIDQIDALIDLRVKAQNKNDNSFLYGLNSIKMHAMEFKLELERSSSLQSENTEILKDVETYKEYNKSGLTRNQIVFFMSAFRQAKITTSDLNDSELAKEFHILTGFSETKLRQQLSEFKKAEIEYSEQDKNTLKETLEKISKAIELLPSKNK